MWRSRAEKDEWREGVRGRVIVEAEVIVAVVENSGSRRSRNFTHSERQRFPGDPCISEMLPVPTCGREAAHKCGVQRALPVAPEY